MSISDLLREGTIFYINFWKKVIQTDTDQCWQWIGATQSQGYGSFSINGKTYLAHRISFIISQGEIPEGLCVLHHCDNRCCVNPSHLFLGTIKDNVQDMIIKGRRANRQLILSGERVYLLLELARNSDMNYKQIAGAFNISTYTVGSVINGKYPQLPLCI